MTRRYLPIMSAGRAAGHRDDAAAAAGGRRGGWRRARHGQAAMRCGWRVLALVAWGFWSATGLVRPHVEYAGIIPRLEALASRFSPQDLLVVESRNASDVHVLALPLAYIYDKPVLVLNSPKPDKAVFEMFLGWARQQLSRRCISSAAAAPTCCRATSPSKPVASERFQIPEYESLRNAYPTRVRFKEFDFGIYRFVPPSPASDGADARHRRAGRPAGGAVSREGTRPAWHVSVDTRAVVSEPARRAGRRPGARAVDGQRRPPRRGATGGDRGLCRRGVAGEGRRRIRHAGLCPVRFPPRWRRPPPPAPTR